MTQLALGGPARALERASPLRHEPFALHAQHPAGLSQRDAGRPALEQRGADARLELLDLAAERGLADVQPRRRPAEVTRLGDGEERAHQP